MTNKQFIDALQAQLNSAKTYYKASKALNNESSSSTELMALGAKLAMVLNGAVGKDNFFNVVREK